MIFWIVIHISSTAVSFNNYSVLVFPPRLCCFFSWLFCTGCICEKVRMVGRDIVVKFYFKIKREKGNSSSPVFAISLLNSGNPTVPTVSFWCAIRTKTLGCLLSYISNELEFIFLGAIELVMRIILILVNVAVLSHTVVLIGSVILCLIWILNLFRNQQC